MGLGPIRALTLESARKKARALRVQVDQSFDPLDLKEQDAAVITAANPTISRFTFRKCAEAYLKAHDAGWKNKKSPAQWKATLEQYAYPFIGNMQVSEITVNDVIKVIDPIWSRINETASRLRGRMEKILGWATVLGYRSGENPARWAGYLSEVYPKRAAVRTVKHHNALPYKEMPSFMLKLKSDNNMASLLLQFLILTARVDAVCNQMLVNAVGRHDLSEWEQRAVSLFWWRQRCWRCRLIAVEGLAHREYSMVG